MREHIGDVTASAGNGLYSDIDIVVHASMVNDHTSIIIHLLWDAQ